MRVVMEAVDELLDVLVHERVVRNLVRPRLRLAGARQVAVQEQVRDLEERAVLGEFFDRVSAVPQNALLTVDERDGAAAVGGIQEGRVVGQQPIVVLAGLDLAQIGGADGAIGDRNLVAPAGPGVGDLKHALAGFCHRGSALFLARRLAWLLRVLHDCWACRIGGVVKCADVSAYIATVRARALVEHHGPHWYRSGRPEWD